MEDLKDRLVDEILRSGALIIGEFKLKSGRISPFFFNIAKMFTPRSLSLLGSIYASTIRDLLDLKAFDAIVGPSYKGVPIAVATSLKIYELYGEDKPVLYDRKEAKKYGVKEEELIIGSAPRGARLVMVDDVLTTGATKASLKRLLEELGFKVVGLVVLLDREELEEGIPASTVLEREGLKFKAVMGATELFQRLWAKASRGLAPLSKNDMLKIKEYYDAYGAKKLLLSVEDT